jgi:hypothetical protein
MRAALWVSAIFGALGLLIGPLLFVLVAAGIVEATGAPPYGALHALGWFGAMIAFLLHAAFGMVTGIIQIWTIPVGVFLLLFGTIGVLRRTTKRYVPLLGPLLWIGALVVAEIGYWLFDWAGSVIVTWDAAAAFSATVGTALTTFGLIPLSGVLIWRWCVSQPDNWDDFFEYANNVKAAGEIVGNWLGVFCYVAIGVGLLSVVIWSWEHWGPIVTILGGLFICGAMLRWIQVIVGATGMLFGYLSILSIGMPAASIVTLVRRKPVSVSTALSRPL